VALLAIVNVLRQTIGLNPEAIGTETVERAVRQRMTQCHISDTLTYLQRLQQSQQEVEALIEEVIVPETWFFRDQVPFTYLGRYVMIDWLTEHPNSAFRVLSLACSSGEEPHSIAMALLDTGLTPQRFHIDAVDVSHAMLRKARRAVYGRHSFRGDELALRQRYVEPTAEGMRVHEWVRTMVTFIQGNALDMHLLADRQPYDSIFCRNMLIYFDQPGRNRACMVLDRLLKPGGVLFVGYAEMGLFLRSGYLRVPYPRAFAYRKPDEPQGRPAIQEALPAASRPVGRPVKPGTSRVTQPQLIRSSVSVPRLAKPPRRPDTPETILLTARQLADQGDLDNAAALCESSVHQHGPSAQAYFLLGLIRQAAGHIDQADQDFNRAVYLQPDHYEALIHLALLAEHRGDKAGAAVLRHRAQRTQRREQK